MKKIFLFILIVLITITTANALVGQPVQAPTSSECANITSLGLVKYGIILDQQKVISLFSASDESLSYYCTKSILGLWDYDIYIEITDLSGNYVVLNNSLVLVYGVYPGKISSASILKQVDRNKLGGYSWASPNYVSTAALSDIKTRIYNSQQQALKTGSGGITPTSAPGYSIDYAYALGVVDKITPDTANYELSRTFTRYVLLNTGANYQLVKLTMGVWS